MSTGGVTRTVSEKNCTKRSWLAAHALRSKSLHVQMNIRSLRIMAAPAKHSVKLYYDVISPFSYIAFEVLLRYSKRWENMDLKLQPVWIAGIMDAVGNTPPGALPARGRYLTF